MAIIIACSSGVILTPLLMRRTKSVKLAGHFFALILTLGFLGLCFVEGGVHGHAIAWLVSVPLCALLLIGKKSAGPWVLISFSAASIVVGFDLAGVKLTPTYDPQWTSVVSAAGYLGLVLFLFILGLIFETGRARAADKMQKALAELAGSNDRLVRLNNEKNEFLEIAAHDLKIPLTIIIGSAELLIKKEASEKSKERAGTIIAATRRMRNLISNLLDANAIEAGAFTSKIVRCDMGRLIAESVANHQAAADGKQIMIRVGASKELFAKADHSAVLQILDNLISNALKFSPPNTTVHVHSVPEKDFILVTVRDEGPGISEEDQKKLFQMFSRLSARPTGDESSTGLGLAIVKRLTEAMAGTIQCHSVMCAGATFALRLPVWPSNLFVETTDRIVHPHARATFQRPLDFESRN